MKVTMDGKKIRVYIDWQTWIVFERFGVNDLFCGHVSSCATAEQHIDRARKLARQAIS
jgi:hypothetical protein